MKLMAFLQESRYYNCLLKERLLLVWYYWCYWMLNESACLIWSSNMKSGNMITNIWAQTLNFLANFLNNFCFKKMLKWELLDKRNDWKETRLFFLGETLQKFSFIFVDFCFFGHSHFVVVCVFRLNWKRACVSVSVFDNLCNGAGIWCDTWP